MTTIIVHFSFYKNIKFSYIQLYSHPMVYTIDIQQLSNLRTMSSQFLQDILSEGLPEAYLSFTNFLTDENLYSITASELKPLLHAISINSDDLQTLKIINKEFIKLLIRGLNFHPEKKIKNLLKDIGYHHLS